MTAAEVHAHERRSYMTRGKKVRKWRAAIREHLQALVEVANANLGAGIREGELSVDFRDGVQESPMQLAQYALAMRNAEAASTDTLVRVTHPDWTDDQVADEVLRIAGQRAAADPMMDDPTDAGL